jgi:hypothetical protein
MWGLELGSREADGIYEELIDKSTGGTTDLGARRRAAGADQVDHGEHARHDIALRGEPQRRLDSHTSHRRTSCPDLRMQACN